MEKKTKLGFIILFSTIILLSCKNNIEQVNIKPRISFLSSNGSNIEVSVVPENTVTGDVINGALVLVQDSYNSVTVLDFDSQKQCYYGLIENSLESEIFSVYIKSCLCDTILVKVPHNRLSVKPNILILEDSEGNSVLSGKNVSANLPIQIAWSNLGEGFTYRVNIQEGSNTVFTSSTKTNTLILPKNVLSKNLNYYLIISAYKDFGDVYFIDSNYFSSSCINSVGLLFYAN